MSWFSYKDQQIRKYRKGIYLRIRSLPDDLAKKIKAESKKTLLCVEVKELRPNSQVLLEIWCFSPSLLWWKRKKPRKYTVFHLLVDENPDWICEGDMGRGFVTPKVKGTSNV